MPTILEPLSVPQLGFLAILLVAFGLLVTEWLRHDIVAVLIILALATTRVLTPSEALAGFSSEAAIVAAAVFVLSAGLHHTGLAETIGGWIGRRAGDSYTRAVAVIMPSVSLLSAFTHHLTTTALMLPVTLNLARERGIPPSKPLMPLSFAASLGTTITIIGAPAFLIASHVLQQAGRPGLGIFSIAPIGLSLSLAGTAFMLLAGRFLLPTRTGVEDPTQRFRLTEYFTEVTILPNSPFLDKTAAEVEHAEGDQVAVVGWLRHGRHLRPPFGERRPRAGDVLLVRTTPEEILAIRQTPGVELHPVSQYGSTTVHGDEEDVADLLVQAVVAPQSDLIGRTIAEVDFRQRYGALVVSLWRKEGWLQQELAQTRLSAGDVLVLQGDAEALARVEGEPAFLMLVPFHGEPRRPRKASLAGGIMLASIVVAAFNLLSIEMAALAGAVAMVLSGCLSARQAYQAIDARIYVFIAGAIPLGTAMQQSGTSDLLAGSRRPSMAGARRSSCWCCSPSLGWSRSSCPMPRPPRSLRRWQ
jgi:di/tricarboxylate transporter